MLFLHAGRRCWRWFGVETRRSAAVLLSSSFSLPQGTIAEIFLKKNQPHSVSGSVLKSKSVVVSGRNLSVQRESRAMVHTRASSRKMVCAVTLEKIIENLRYNTNRYEGPYSPVSEKHAAVLIPLFRCSSDGEIHVLLTRRSSSLRSHSGEVCLPGGKRDPGDIDDAATALREAHEELGLDSAKVEIIGRLPPVLSKHLLSVTAIIGSISEETRCSVRPNPNEVSHVFSAPLKMFLTAGPEYSYRDVRWEPANLPYRLHYWDFKDSEEGVSHLIWGLTAGILILTAEWAFDAQPEFRVCPPGSQPYTSLAYENGRLIFRGKSGASASGSAAIAVAKGGQVTQEEADAAVGDTTDVD